MRRTTHRQPLHASRAHLEPAYSIPPPLSSLFVVRAIRLLYCIVLRYQAGDGITLFTALIPFPSA